MWYLKENAEGLLNTTELWGDSYLKLLLYSDFLTPFEGQCFNNYYFVTVLSVILYFEKAQMLLKVATVCNDLFQVSLLF